jgi:hypothetical protein
MPVRWFQLCAIVATVAFAAPVFGQDDAAQAPDKRILGIVPNYRTFPTLHPYKPITVKEKFDIAREDSFDRGAVVLALLFAGEGQISASNPEFGGGAKAYAHYAATSFADFTVGNYMTEAIYPTLFHQDPRYFRRGTGNPFSRLGYAAGQIFWTHTDRGGTALNYSELAGNATAVAIGTAYYPNNRDAPDAISRWGMQLGVDMAANVLKEFWPDLHHKFSKDKN